MNVLVADDDGISRLLLEATIARLGHDVTTVVDGEAAWTALERGAFAVLITDLLMPRLDGFELVRRVRARAQESYLYVILLTTAGGKVNLLNAIDAGVDDFVTKPFDPQLLAARVHVAERIVGVHRRAWQLEGLLPICAWCKRIKDGQSQWTRIEQYLADRSEARFSHGICPECSASAAGADR